MTPAAIVAYAYDQIDQARADLKHLGIEDICDSRKFVSNSCIR